MKIYKLGFDLKKYENLFPKGEHNWEFYQMFDGRSIVANWKKIELVRSTKSSKLPLGDVAAFTFTVPVLNKAALDILMPLMEDSVDIVTFEFEGNELYGVIVTDVVDVVDYEKSSYTTLDDEKIILTFEKYAFLCDKIGGRNIFKIPDENKDKAFVSEAFYNKIKEAGLKGFKLEEVYDSEAVDTEDTSKDDDTKELKEETKADTNVKDDSTNEEPARDLPKISLGEENLHKLVELMRERTKGHTIKVSLKEGETSLCSSKFGGYPYWTADREYPIDSDGDNLILLAQINLSDFEFEGLPDCGLLQFFVSFDECLGLDDEKGYKVVYHESIDTSVTEDTVKEMGILSNQDLHQREGHWFPSYESYQMLFENSDDDSICIGDMHFEEELKGVLKESFGIDMGDQSPNILMKSEEYKYLIDEFDVFENKMLGNPNFCQVDPRDYIEDKNKYDTLLLQLVSNEDGDETDLEFADGGSCNFFINHRDLANRNFDDVLYDWTCG